MITLLMTHRMGKPVATLWTLSFLIFSSISHCWLSVLSVTQNSFLLVLLMLVFFVTLSQCLCSSHFSHIFWNHTAKSYFAFCIYFPSNAVSLFWRFLHKLNFPEAKKLLVALLTKIFKYKCIFSSSKLIISKLRSKMIFSSHGVLFLF